MRRGARRRVRLAVVLAVLALAVLVTLPPSPLQVTGADPALAQRTVRGAFHVHTTRSDGLGDKTAVASAARRAGLQFLIFTDHGDGTRAADPPLYLDGVLCVEGVEVSTDGGHYIALGAAPSPYPLGGESAAVVEDVSRLGGFGIAAHPGSPRRELAWADWSLPVDALEWLSADSEWRDESRWQLARALVAYTFRPAGALGTLLDRPATVARWDAIAGDRRVLAIAGHDAHGGVGPRVEDPSQRRSVRVPSYEASFRTFSTRVELDRPLTADAGVDGLHLLETLRAGRFYTAIDVVATGATFEFDARAADAVARQGGVLRAGDVLHPGGLVSFRARAAVPRGATIVGLRNGVEIARAPGGALDFQSAERGAYRVEVHVAGAPGSPPVPWLVSNPIFHLPALPGLSPRPPVSVLPLRQASWRIEKSDGSDGAVRVGPGGEVRFDYRLRGGQPASQFVALVVDLPPDPPAYDGVAFVARSDAPQRVSVQLRFANDGDARWRTSVYVDSSARPQHLAVDDLRRADGPASRPDVRRATSLLFVVDLTNANPGDSGSLTVSEVRVTG